MQTWRSENEITTFYRDNIRVYGVRPDGYGYWVQHRRALGFFLEHDTGTERLSRAADKLTRYAGSATGPRRSCTG